ncbi:hypothetical protein CV016_14795 [Yersinia kristensenii]|nr:hypothetical protein CU276_15465 [Yersinia kristensenii]PJG61911.1 hypothetical protein CV016_14795 [Yersinia kristensenii]
MGKIDVGTVTSGAVSNIDDESLINSSTPFFVQPVDIFSKDSNRLSPIYDFLMKIERVKKSHSVLTDC